MSNKIKTVFIVGPTASGKTTLSIELAKVLGGEVVSADSMQIYKGIHIASAAPEKEEMQNIPHHLLEFISASSQFSVADYVKLARECIKEIDARGNIPIVVGGTGLYISSLADNTNYTDVNTDLELRTQLEEEFDKLGAEEMLKRLAEFDSDTAAKLHENDRRRIIRAFELYKTTGFTKTEQNDLSHKGEETVEPIIIGITYRDRQNLYDRINKRVDIMLLKGLLDEARQSYNLAGTKGGFQAIGHKELYSYFDGECSLEQAAENLKMQTRRYAKRQLTWFRKDERINWIYADETEYTLSTALDFVKKYL